MMTPQRRAEMEKEAAKTEQAAKDSGKAKKQPSLLRKGETIKK